jgi:hypothetical protein
MASPLIVIRVALAGVFVIAGWAKLRRPDDTRTDIAALGLPRWVVAPVSVGLPVLELLVAALLLIEPVHEIAAGGAVVLLGLFTAVVVANLLRGRRPACACFGALAKAPIAWMTVCRNLALMVAAGSLIREPLSRIDVPIPSATVVAMVAVGLGAAWLVLLTRQNGRLLVRLDQLERQTDAPPSPPAVAGPIEAGATVPPLRLNDARGRPFDLASLRGRPVVLLFVDGACSHCRPLLAELRGAVLDDATVALVVISDSGSLRHDLPADTTVVVDVGWSTRELFGVRGTPAAVMIDADGALAPQSAVHGTPAVRAALIRARVLTEEMDRELAPV